MLQASAWRQTAPWRRRQSTQAPQQRRSSRIPLRVSSMFTGIVQGTAEVANVDRRSNFSQLQISFPAGRMADVQLGASVAINGTCLTVTDVQHDTVSFDVMMETLRATSLGELTEGSHVNFERSARVGDEIGGHNVSGHVHCKARVAAVEDLPNNRRLVFELPDDRWMKYILPKVCQCRHSQQSALCTDTAKSTKSGVEECGALAQGRPCCMLRPSSSAQLLGMCSLSRFSHIYLCVTTCRASLQWTAAV